MVLERSRLIRVLLVVFLLGVSPGFALAQDFALAIYGGQLTKENWEKAITPEADFADATIVVAAGSWTIARLLDNKLTCELEAQVGKYFGDQDHWEVNLPIIGLRWHRFPWEEFLATSFAWGIGPSYATRVPEIEVETRRDSSRWLIYWFGEFGFGPPAARWEVLLRLHHRSGGFGTVADDGGSNALCAGMRYRF